MNMVAIAWWIYFFLQYVEIVLDPFHEVELTSQSSKAEPFIEHCLFQSEQIKLCSPKRIWRLDLVIKGSCSNASCYIKANPESDE